MTGHLWRAAGRTLAEGWELFGVVFVLAVVLWFVSQRLRGYGSELMGRVYYWLVAPGVVCHETGHALGCLLTGTKIFEFVPFCPAGNTLGYVSHETKPGLLWKMGQFFIATGPVWFGCAVIVFAAHLFTGEEFLSAFGALAPRPGEGIWVHCKGVWYGAIWMLQTVFAPWRWGTPLFPLFVYLVFCVASEITLSPPDLEGMWQGLAAIVAVLFLLNLVPEVSEWLARGITALRPMVFVAQTLLFFVLLADLAFLGAIRLVWSVFSVASKLQDSLEIAENRSITAASLSPFFPFLFFCASPRKSCPSCKSCPKILPPEKFSNHWEHFFQSLENLRRAAGPADCAKPGGGSVFRQDLQDLQDFGRPSSTGRPKTDHSAQELTTLHPPASRQYPENALFPPVSAVGTERA